MPRPRTLTRTHSLTHTHTYSCSTSPILPIFTSLPFCFPTRNENVEITKHLTGITQAQSRVPLPLFLSLFFPPLSLSLLLSPPLKCHWLQLKDISGGMSRVLVESLNATSVTQSTPLYAQLVAPAPPILHCSPDPSSCCCCCCCCPLQI